MNPNITQIGEAIQKNEASEPLQKKIDSKELDERPDEGTTSKVNTESSLLEKQNTAESRQKILSKQIQAAAPPTADLLEHTDDAKRFHSAIQAAKNDGKQEDIESGTFGTKKSKWHGGFVHTYPETDYESMDLLLQKDDSAGVAVKQSQDIVSVFKHPKKGIKGISDVLIREAIENGGVYLDCFNGFLPKLYSSHGLVPLAKLKFDREFAPADWNYERDGEPDIIFMTYDPVAAANIEKDDVKRDEWISQIIAKLPYSRNYEEAEKMQREYTLNRK